MGEIRGTGFVVGIITLGCTLFPGVAKGFVGRAKGLPQQILPRIDCTASREKKGQQLVARDRKARSAVLPGDR